MPNRLPFGVKLAFGFGELGPAMAGSTMIFFLMVFLTDVAGLNPAMAGSVLLIGKVWDAVNDPLIGWLADRTRSDWGRRLPWIVWSAIPFALLFALHWWVPPYGHDGDASQWALFWHFVAVSIFFNTAYTALSLPYSALLPELTHDYDERSRLAGFRMGASLAGSVGGLLLALVVFSALDQAPPSRQYFLYGVVVALVGLGSVVVCLVGIWKASVAADRARRVECEQLSAASRTTAGPLDLRGQLRIVFSNRPFLLVCAIYLFSWLALQFTATILPYYVTNWMGREATDFQMVALTVQGTAFLLIPMWSWASVRLSKRTVYFLGMAFWIAAQFGLLFLQPGQVGLMYGLAFAAGFGVSVCYLIPNAMLPDVMEQDELETGERREGVFFGFFVFLQKSALALGTFVVGQVLAASGYQASGPGAAPVEQPEAALMAIRLSIGPLPMLSLLLGVVACWFYPITREKHAELLGRIEARKRGEDPA